MTPTVRQTCHQDHLQPTPAQVQALEEVLGRWGAGALGRWGVLDTTAREPRRTGGRRGHGHRATRFSHEAPRKALRAALPEYATVHAPVLPEEVLARLDRTSPAFLRCVPAGPSPGWLRFQGHTRSPSFPSQASGTGARLDTGFRVRATMGRLAVRGRRAGEACGGGVPWTAHHRS